ncbi:hypothetical protein Rs2_18061 [Raphanus sativus]|nr:hypothetical protein Rs2_18061 [Raphanus sativus]
MTTTRSDSDERLAKDPQTSRNGFSQDSLKVVSLPPLEKKKDSVGEMMSSKKEVKPPPLASVLEEDEETIRSDSAEEASLSKEPEAMDVDCHGVFSVPETTTSPLLQDDGIGEELQRFKETSAAKVSEAGSVEADASVEKRRLLRKNDVDTKEQQHQKMERVRVKDNAFVGRSVNIDLVDDTALLNVVPFCTKKVVKDHHPKDAPRKHKKHNGGKQQQQQDKGNASTSGNELRIVYSINQMKSMRYAHPANQKKLWSDVYARLLPELVNEYEGLVGLKNQKTAKSNMRESVIGIFSVLYPLYQDETV